MGLFQRRGSAGANGHTAVAEVETTPTAAEEASSASPATAVDVVTEPSDTTAAAAEEASSASPATAVDVVTEPSDTTAAAAQDEQPVDQNVEDASPDAAVPTHPVAAVVAERPPFGLDDFPALPLGPALWSDEIANVINLKAVVPRLPNSLLVLTDAAVRAAAVVTDGIVVDAVWVGADGGLLGEEAAHAILTAATGTLTAYISDDARLASVLPILWRSSRLGPDFPAAWIHTDDLVAEMRTSRRTCALLVASADPGVALFNDGALVGAFTTAHPWPGKSIAALWNLTHTPGARVTVIGDSGNAAEAQATPDEPRTVTVPKRQSRVSAAKRAAATLAAEQPAPAASVEESSTATGDRKPAWLMTADEVPEAMAEAEIPQVTGHDGASTTQAGTERATDVADQPVSTPTPVTDATPHAVTEDAVVAAATTADTQVEQPNIPASNEHDDSDGAGTERSHMEMVESREAGEFVAPRLDIDVDALRTELSEIAVTWLGADDARPVVSAIGSARAGVDDFVSAIAVIGAMEVPGHERAVVRAMGREMHYRATEVLCGV